MSYGKSFALLFFMASSIRLLIRLLEIFDDEF